MRSRPRYTRAQSPRLRPGIDAPKRDSTAWSLASSDPCAASALKTAERLVLELKDKVAKLSFDHKADSPMVDTSARVDVYAALIALGYAEKEINLVLKNFPNDLDVNNGIRWALQQFSK